MFKPWQFGFNDQWAIALLAIKGACVWPATAHAQLHHIYSPESVAYQVSLFLEQGSGIDLVDLNGLLAVNTGAETLSLIHSIP